MVPDHLFPLKAEQLLEGVVDETETARLVENVDDVRRVLHQVPIAPLGLLELPGYALLLPDEPALFEGVVHPLDQLLVLRGLADVIEGAVLERCDRRLDRGEAGDHDDQNLREIPADVGQHVVPVEVRKHHVQEYQIEAPASQALNGLLSRGGHVRLVTVTPQEVLETLPHPRLIIHDENSAAVFHSSLTPLLSRPGRHARAPAGAKSLAPPLIVGSDPAQA